MCDKINTRKYLRKAEFKDKYRMVDVDNAMEHLFDPKAKTYTPIEEEFAKPRAR